jgi:hypothetical protein
MASRNAHLWVGTVSGLGLAAYQARNEQPAAFATETIGGALGGRVASLAPDWIEPAIHSWHRSTAHSYLTAGAIATTAHRRLSDWQRHCRAKASTHEKARQAATTTLEQAWHALMAFIWRFLSGFVAGLPAGYLSHLLLDAVTPRGIPLVA